MEIKIDKEAFFKSVARVQSIIERKSNMPILSTILLTTKDGKLQVSATDLELGFQQTIPVDVIQEGHITISGRKLFEILKESQKSVFHIKEKENNWVYISDGITRFDLACLPVDEYPFFVEPEEITFVDISGDILSEMVNKTIYAVTIEEAGFKLSGVYTQKVAQEGKPFLRMVATDGHRLSMIDKKIENIESLDLGSGLMIPKKGMSELNKLAIDGGTVQIGFKHKHCVAKKENSLLIIRLLEAKFPDYHAVIPKEEKYIIELDRLSLIQSMRKMLILSNERYKAVKIALEEDTMELVSTNPDLGEAQESLKISFRGNRLEAGFNPRFFLDTLQSMESENIQLGFIDNSKPCIIKGEADKGFLGLIMPMRL